MPSAQPIASLEQLKKEANTEEGRDFFILLAHGWLRSSKWIRWDDDERRFFVRNEIDDTEQELTEKQIMDNDYTLIGEAIEKGALFMYAAQDKEG